MQHAIKRHVQLVKYKINEGNCKSGWLKKEIPKLRTVAIFIPERVWWIEREIGSGRRRRRKTDPTVLGERNCQLGGE